MPDLYTPDWETASNIVRTAGDALAEPCASSPPGQTASCRRGLGTHTVFESVLVTRPFVCKGVGAHPLAHAIGASASEPTPALLAAYDELRQGASARPSFETVTELICAACAEMLLADAARADADGDAQIDELPARHDPQCAVETHGPRARARHAKSASPRSAVPSNSWCSRHAHERAREVEH